MKYLGQCPTSVRVLVDEAEPEKIPDLYCPWGWQYLLERDDGSFFLIWNQVELRRWETARETPEENSNVKRA